MEVTGLEESHASALAEVAKQVEFLVGEEVSGVVVERFEIFNK
jgi:hypothetical protein